MGQLFDSRMLKLLLLNTKEKKIKLLSKGYIDKSQNILGTDVFSHTYKFSVHFYKKFCFVLLWFGLVWFGLVWFGLVWFGLVWFGLVWFVGHPDVCSVLKKPRQRENNDPPLAAHIGGCRLLLVNLAYSQPSFALERHHRHSSIRNSTCHLYE